MQILAKLVTAFQKLFNEKAEVAAEASGVIVRQRKFTASSLAMTFVMGYLQKPDASDEELAQIAVQCGAVVTPQAVSQRHSSQMVAFLEALFREAAKDVIGSDKALAPILERFASVTALDSSAVAFPDSEQEKYPGCGGSHGGGKAAMKLQTEFDLRGGGLEHIEVETGRSSDNATSRQFVKRPKGSLRITDLGYFCVPVFAGIVAEGAHFLSRLQYGTNVQLQDGEEVEVLTWLSAQAGPFVDVSILLSKEHRFPCRMIAWRLPPEQADQRRRKLRQETRSKKGREPSAERLAWCDWTILVTSVPLELLTPAEAVILYRARWQIELLFKRWKSQGLVAQLSGSTDERQMVRVWARLLAALVQHWLLIGSAWGDPARSWVKVWEASRKFAGRLVAALNNESELLRVLTDLYKVVTKTCRRDKRSKPGTAELLNDPSLLDYCF